MYESRFGLTAPPFNLSPDPTFYFESRGHGHALSYLKFGVHQGEGFIVVTGEIGAGKTTLVRTLLENLADSSVVAAQIVSTQLEANDLLRAVATAFGVESASTQSKAHLIVAIEAFLLTLTTQGRRALLIVDEAQNLGREAVEELRMLSNFQLGNRSLLQSFLVGQPELRRLIASKPMEQFRQRVIASCHLGPMDPDETRAYVEHRLTKAGWSNKPSFSADAFRQIFVWTGGIPRRVNLLCNRLLLSAYLTDHDAITERTVVAVASELRDEVSELTESPEVDIRPANLGLAEQATHSACGPIMLIAAHDEDELHFKSVVRLSARNQSLLHFRLVRVGPAAPFAHNEAHSDRGGEVQDSIRLPQFAEGDGAAALAESLASFASLIRSECPSAFVVRGYSEPALSCLLAARAAGVPVAHVQVVAQDNTLKSDWLEFARIVTLHISKLFFVTDVSLLAGNVSEARIRSVPADTEGAAAAILNAFEAWRTSEPSFAPEFLWQPTTRAVSST